MTSAVIIHGSGKTVGAMGNLQRSSCAFLNQDRLYPGNNLRIRGG